MNCITIDKAEPNKYRLASNIYLHNIEIARAGAVLDYPLLALLRRMHINTVNVNPLPTAPVTDILSTISVSDAEMIDSLITDDIDIDKVKAISKQITNIILKLPALSGEVTTISNKCSSTENLIDHCVGTAVVAGELAIVYGLNEAQTETVIIAGLLHDLGKNDVPDDVLFAPRKLTDDEWEVMHKHPYFGYKRLIEQPWATQEILNAVLNHHENWNGTGYPNKLAGKDIGLYGSILHIADVYDALARPRSYKTGWEISKIITFLNEESGKQFSPELIKLITNNIPIFEKNTLVKLSDEKLAIVLHNTINHILQPVVMYADSLINITELDLSKTDITVQSNITLM